MKNYILKILSIALLASLFTACSEEENVTYNESKDEVLKNGTANNEVFKNGTVKNEMFKNKFPAYLNRVDNNIDGNNIVMTSVHFKYDSYKVEHSMNKVVADNVNKISGLIDNNKNLKIKLEGNCDEWGNDEYNFALGLKRAKAVKVELINKGINKKNILIVSLGESNPICKEKTKDCWKRNRRVDHKLLP